MSKRTVSGIILTLLIIGMLTLSFNIQPVETEQTTYTRWQRTIHTSSIDGNQTTHVGDLIIDRDEIFAIENCTYIQTGNVYVRDNASLTIRNAELRLNQTSDWQYSIRVNMSATLETRNATIRNHVSPVYSLGIYFSGNSTPLLIDSKLKNVFCYFPSSIDIKGNVYVYNSDLDRMVIGWVHNAVINCSTIGSLEFRRGGFLGLHPMVCLLSSNVGRLYFNDFGGTLFTNAAIIESLSLEGVGLKILGNITFSQSATVRMTGHYTYVKRNFNIISLNKEDSPLEDVRLALYSQHSTLIWSGFTDSSGKASFNLTFTPSNYTSILRLEASKGTSLSTKNIKLLSDTPVKMILLLLEYNIAVNSFPSGVTFTIDNVSHTTPWSETYIEGTSVNLEMPETHIVGDARYYWNQWSDGNTSRTRTVTMDTDITLTAQYTILEYQLTVTSSPITGIPFTINGVPQTTPYTEWLPEGSYTLGMPQTHNGYVWSHWLEDGDTNRIKTITLPGTTYTAVYTEPPIGGYSLPTKGYTAEKSLTLYLAIVAILTVSFTMIKRKMDRRTKRARRRMEE